MNSNILLEWGLQSDGISWLDEPAVDLGNASHKQFDVAVDIDLDVSALWDVLSDHPFVIKAQMVSGPSHKKGKAKDCGMAKPVEWKVSF